MTRASRHNEKAALKDAAIRRAALSGAGDGAGWLTEIDANLLRRLDATPRLQSRLVHIRGSIGGDPACLPVEAGHLMTLSPQMQRDAAIFAGLTYHLSAFGPALGQDRIVALTAMFSQNALAFALRHSRLSPPASTVLSFEEENVRWLIEADGWAILSIWVAECGLAPVWLDDWHSRRDGGSISVTRSAAIAIGTAVATALWETRAGAEQ